jgi:hypothetical protein
MISLGAILVNLVDEILASTVGILCFSDWRQLEVTHTFVHIGSQEYMGRRSIMLLPKL